LEWKGDRKLKKKVLSKALLGLLITGLLASTLNIAPVLSFPNSPSASSNVATLPTAKPSTRNYPVGLSRQFWDFSRTDGWTEFAELGEDFVEMVIGVDTAKPNSLSGLSALVSQSGGATVNTLTFGGKQRAVVVSVPRSNVASFADKVKASGFSTYVEPNMKFQASLTPNDPNWTLQWGPTKIEADYAWNTTMGSSSVLVAVIDTGIAHTHPDLAANYVALGYDWVNNDNNPMDDEGHGTHCAGIIAAVTNNGKGIAGMAQVKIMAEKGLDDQGSGSSIDLAHCIIDAVDKGADILSMSWGSYFYSNVIHEALEYADSEGVLCIGAAGNEGTSLKHYPAALPEVVSVSATTTFDTRATWSNYGNWIELGAPGEDIFSTYAPSGYASLSGTSMACPHVAGVAALAWSQFATYPKDWIRNWLRYTSNDLGSPGFDTSFGYGRVNARKAVEDTPPEHDLLASNWEKPTYVELGNVMTVNTTVVNFGTTDESSISVQLLVNGTVENSTIISSLTHGESTVVSLSWASSTENMYNVTSYVVPVAGETRTGDNALSEPLFVDIETIIVPDHVSTIQYAIDIAVDGFTIFVRNGLYNENVYVNKPLSLVGESKEGTIIRGTDSIRGAVVYVLTDNVNITGFTLKKSGLQQTYYAGVLLDWVSNISVYGNIFTENMAGVFLWECYNCSIYNNNMTKNYDYAVAIHNSTFCNVWGNLAVDNKAAFWLNYSRDCLASDNTGRGNDFGFELNGSSDCLVYENDFADNAYGANVSVSSGNRIFHNRFSNSTVAQVVNDIGSVNEWDNGYSDGGNFWANHVTTDLNYGPYQNITGADGIVDTPFNINGGNRDRYPLTKQFSEYSHDVALLEATPTQAQIDGGQTLNFTVAVENLGGKVETVIIDIYGNGTLLESETVPFILPATNQTLTVGWNTVGFVPGTYSIEAEASQVAGETELANNAYADGTVEIVAAHDVAPMLIMPSKTVVGKGYTVSFNVTVLNKGNFNETFNVTLYADLDIGVIGDEVTIGTSTTPELQSAASAVFSFTWNTTPVPMGHYVMSAYATPVDSETFTADNTFVNGEVYVAVPGDVDGNRIVNMLDLYKIALVFGANEGDSKYVAVYDIDGNGKINMLDLYIAALNFGKSGP
jgi:thermitase